MKIPALLTLLFVSAANAYPTGDTPSDLHSARRDSSAEHYAKSLLTRLENKVKLSDASLPKLDYTKEWQYICAANIWEGDQVAFWRTGSFGPEDIKSTNAYYVAHVESTAVNTGVARDEKIVVTQSTTSTQVKTDGWTIGAKLSGTGGQKDVASGTVEVSGSYSNSQEDTNSRTRTVSHETSCAPGHECRIETWTFHLDIQANATLLSNWQLWALRYGFDEERHICDMEPYMRDCGQFASRHDEWCDPGQSGVNSAGNFGWNLQPRYELVRMKIPVYEENGYQPLSRVVLVSTPINDSVGQLSKSTEVGTRESITQAIEIGTKFQFLD